MNPSARPGDLGLLSPAWAGSAAARLCDDTAVLQAMLDVERAWVGVCARAGLGAAPAEVAGMAAGEVAGVAAGVDSLTPEARPAHAAHDDPAPHHSVPHHSTPYHSVPDGPMPDGPMPDGPMPDGPVPDRAVPDGPMPDNPALDAPAPDHPAPDDLAWDAAHYDLASIAARTPLGGNPLIPLLSDLRSALAGHPQAPLVHLGATSQDVIDTALMVLAARVIDDALPRLDAACDALAALADRHRDTLCVARSLGQHALPSTFGLRAARWLDGLSQAGARLRDVRAELPLQWVGAAGTGAALVARARRGPNATGASPAQLRAALAAELGLRDSVGWHTTRTPVLRLGAALAEAVAAAGTLATDVVTGSRNEIGELAEPRAPGRGGSSAMPHKANPVLSVTIRSAALSAPGLLGTLAAAAGQAGDERPDGAWHAEWPALRELLRLTGGVAAVVAELATGLRVDAAALRRHLDASTPAVLAEWASITGADAAALDPSGYLGESDAFVEAILREHAARTAARTAAGSVPPTSAP